MKKISIILLSFLFSLNAFALLNLDETAKLEYGLAVQMGKIANAKVAQGFFKATNLTTVEKTVWDGPGIYVYPPTATQMTVSSTSVNDTLAGTGAQKISIECLDANYETFIEEVSLNGQTPVTMSGSCFRVQGGLRGQGSGTYVSQVGSLEKNDGIIYIGTGTVTVGVPATIYNLISAGENSSHTGFYTIPAGYTGYFFDAQASSVSNKPLQLTGVERNGVPVFRTFWGNNIDGFIDSGTMYPDKLKEKTDLQFRARMFSGTGEIFAHAHLLLIK